MKFNYLFFGLLLLLFTSQAFAISDTNLVAYYKFDETTGTITDYVGGDNNCTMNGSMGYNATGKINKAITSLEAYPIANYANCGTGTLNFTGKHSINTWVYPTAYGANQSKVIFSKDGGNPQYTLDMGYWGATIGQPKISYYMNSSLITIASPETITANQWVMITATWDGTTDTNKIKLYVNGVLKAQGTATATSLTTSGTRAGFGANEVQSGFTGRIDETGIWTRELTPTEITDLYNAGAGVTYPFVTEYINVDFNYVVRKDLNKIILKDTSTVSGVTKTAWTWTNNGSTISTAQDYNLTATELTDYNICLHVDTNVSDVNGDKCYSFNTGDWTPPVTTFSSFQVPNTTDQNITLTCTDNNTGCKTINYKIDNNVWIKTYFDTNTKFTDGNYYFTSSDGVWLVVRTDYPTKLVGYRQVTNTTMKIRSMNGGSIAGRAGLKYYYTDGTNEIKYADTFDTTSPPTIIKSITDSNILKDVNKIEWVLYRDIAGSPQYNTGASDLNYYLIQKGNSLSPYSFLYSGAGSHSIQYFSTDNSDNNETTKTSTFTTYGNARFNFIDENTYAPVTTTYTITPSINGITTGSATSLDLNLQGITNQLYGFQFSTTSYGTRFYYVDLNEFSGFDYNQLMLKDANAANNITLKIYNATGTTIQAGTPVTITKNNYLVGRYLTNTDGEITPFLNDLDTNYLFNVEGLYTTSQRPVLIYRPKYDSNFADIAGNWQITLTGPNSTNRYTITTNSQVVAILPNTETLYSAKICMLSGSVCSASYFSRTYLLGFKGLVGETSIQPYLNLIADSTLRTLKVLDYATNQPFPLAKIMITSKTDLGVTYIVESLYTDSTGTAGIYLANGQTYTLTANDLTSYTIVPNDATLTYYIYFNFLVLPTETVTGLDVNTSIDFNGAEFFVMRNALFGCSGTSDCFPSALIAIVLTMIILVVATAVTVGNFIGVKGLSLIAFLCFVIFFGIGWLPIYIFAFLGSITLLLLVVVQ